MRERRQAVAVRKKCRHARSTRVPARSRTLQARASDLLGDDWVPCVAEVTGFFDVLVRDADDDFPRNKNGDKADIDKAGTALEVLSALDKTP